MSILVDGVPRLEVGADVVHRTASVGKVLLLVAVATAVDDGRLTLDERLAPHPDDVVADSGLWQHLPEPTLSVASAAALVGAVSDNLATNVLLRRVGLDAVRATRSILGLSTVELHDRVRDLRGPSDPATLSTGSAAELVRLVGRVRTEPALALVAQWLRLGVDLSMTLAPLGLDPLAHLDGPVRVLHKTGTDDGIRADCGSVAGPNGVVDYAVLASWGPGAPGDRRTPGAANAPGGPAPTPLADGIGAALAGHHAVGRLVARWCGSPITERR